MTETEPADPTRWRVLAVLLVAVFMSLMSVGILNVALPSITTGLHASQAQLQWVLSGYALTFGIILVAAGRAGDVYGRGVLFIAGVTIFTGSSIWAGLSPSPYWLDVARFVQGIGSGLINPQALGMIQHYFRGEERGKAFGAYGTSVGVAVATGPLVGGLLINLVGVEDGWRWTFFVNVPIGLLAIILAVIWFPRPLVNRPRSAQSGTSRGRHKPDLDPIGAVLLGLSVFAVLFPFVETDTIGFGLTWLLLPAGLALCWLWVRWERNYASRGREPMVELDIFRTRSFSRGTTLISLYFLGGTSVWVLVALYMQKGLEHSALEAGAVGVPNAVLSAVTANVGSRMVVRAGRIVVVVGMITVLTSLGLSILVLQLHQSIGLSEWWLLATLGLLGAGQGAVISPNQTLTLADVPVHYAGSSGGIMQTGQRVGTSIGIALVTAVVFATLSTSDWTTATTAGLATIAVAIAVALGVALQDMRVRTAPG